MAFTVFVYEIRHRTRREGQQLARSIDSVVRSARRAWNGSTILGEA